MGTTGRLNDASDLLYEMERSLRSAAALLSDHMAATSSEAELWSTVEALDANAERASKARVIVDESRAKEAETDVEALQ